MSTIEKELNNTLVKSSLENTTITGRKKHLYSIYKKMQSNHTSLVQNLLSLNKDHKEPLAKASPLTRGHMRETSPMYGIAELLGP